MTGTCSTCKFWDPDSLRYADPSGWSDCDKALGREPDTLAYASSRDGAILRTSPNFGCVMHEPKRA